MACPPSALGTLAKTREAFGDPTCTGYARPPPAEPSTKPAASPTAKVEPGMELPHTSTLSPPPPVGAHEGLTMNSMNGLGQITTPLPPFSSRPAQGLAGGRAEPLRSVQALRAVAALMVVVYHLVNAELVHGGGVSLLRGPAHFGFAGVDVFFVISGFIMATVTAGRFGSGAYAVDFLVRRAIRIYPLYWICTLAIVALLMIRPDALSTTFSDKSILHSLLLLPQEGGPLLVVGWTLTFELFFYAMTGLALAFVSERRVPLLILAWAGVLMLLQMVPTHSPWAKLLSSPLSFEFMVGALAGLYWRRLPAGMAIPAVVCGVAWMMAAGMLLIDTPGHGQSDGIRVLAFGLPSALLVTGLARMEAARQLNPGAWIVALGDASYSLYLTHLFVLSICGRAWASFGATGTVAGNAAFLVTTLLACCLTSIITYRLIEKPLMRLGDQLLRHQRRWLSIRREP